MPAAERRKLLDRITELNGGDKYLADLYGSAGLDVLRETVLQMEAAREAGARGDRLSDIWKADGGVIVERAARTAAE